MGKPRKPRRIFISELHTVVMFILNSLSKLNGISLNWVPINKLIFLINDWF